MHDTNQCNYTQRMVLDFSLFKFANCCPITVHSFEETLDFIVARTQTEDPPVEDLPAQLLLFICADHWILHNGMLRIAMLYMPIPTASIHKTLLRRSFKLYLTCSTMRKQLSIVVFWSIRRHFRSKAYLVSRKGTRTGKVLERRTLEHRVKKSENFV